MLSDGPEPGPAAPSPAHRWLDAVSEPLAVILKQLVSEAADDVLTSLTRGPKIIVPPITGMTEERARERLTATGVIVKTIRMEAHETVPHGIAIAAEPAAGATLPSGSEVVLVISSGRPAT